jgi:tRNA nucleotidyltransferase (CCA-adding enzyme)
MSLRDLLADPALLPPEELHLLKLVAKEAAARGLPAYVVGGFVRDLLLRKPVNDFDVVVEGDAIKFSRSLAKIYGGRVTAHSKFGTAKWILRNTDEAPASFLDLITARSEIYESPAALPTVKFSALADDIRRRDFTINTLAMRLDGTHFGELRDDLGARSDLENGVIRVLHPNSFIDDPTRIYRAVRYEQRYGFKIEPATLSLIPAARPLISSLSAQRIRRELDLILDEERSASMLARLEELDLLVIIHAELPVFNRAYAALLNAIPPARLGVQYRRIVLGYLLWLMNLPDDTIESLAKRLAFSAELKKSLLAASSLLRDLPSFTRSRPSQWTARLSQVPPLAIYAVSLIADDVIRQSLQTYLAEWRHVKPYVTGDDLKKRGLEPGPKYQEILSRLRDARLDGEIKSREAEINLLDTLS